MSELAPIIIYHQIGNLAGIIIPASSILVTWQVSYGGSPITKKNISIIFGGK